MAGALNDQVFKREEGPGKRKDDLMKIAPVPFSALMDGKLHPIEQKRFPIDQKPRRHCPRWAVAAQDPRLGERDAKRSAEYCGPYKTIDLSAGILYHQNSNFQSLKPSARASSMGTFVASLKWEL